MTAAISWFFEVNLLLVAVCALALTGLFLVRRFPTLGARSMLKFCYVLILSLVFLPFLNTPRAEAPVTEPAARIWASGSMSEINTPQDQGRTMSVHLSTQPAPQQYTMSYMQIFVIFALLAGALVLSVRLTQSLMGQRALLARSWRLRQLGKVEVWAGDVGVPLSFRTIGRKIVLLPVSLCDDPSGWQPALRHELQHHRQGDTLMIYTLCAIKYGLFWNPAAHLLARIVSELQEYACDEALVANRKVSPQVYGRCLLRVATMSRSAHAFPIGAVGMAASASGRLLRRRINMILTRRKTGVFSHLFVLTGLLSMFGVAFAAGGLVRDQRIDAELASALIKNANVDSSFELKLGDGVLQELNRFAGTPDGRARMLAALERMEEYRPMMEEIFQKYNLPMELLALPILESGYKNLEPNRDGLKAAGLWQFIPGTARNFNLRVDEELDERLEPEMATDAAARFLSALHLQYQDWNLALLAYNAGPGKVNRHIQDTGVRDAWVLLEEKEFGDYHYLQKAVAMIIIMKNPHILD